MRQITVALEKPYHVHRVRGADNVFRVFKFPEETQEELAAVRDFGENGTEIFQFETAADRTTKYNELTA